MKYNDDGTYEDIVIKAVAPGRNSYCTSQQEVYSCNYVNGAIDAVDAKVNRNSTYSTTEQVVGTWIDGKPIYRKVLNNFLMPELSVISGTVTVTSPHGIANIDTPISVRGWITYSGNNLQFPIISSGGNITSIHYFDDTNIAFRSSEYWSNRYITVIVEYTKTTD